MTKPGLKGAHSGACTCRANSGRWCTQNQSRSLPVQPNRAIRLVQCHPMVLIVLVR